MGAGRTEAAVPGHAEDSEAQRDGDDEVAEPAETGGDSRHRGSGRRVLQCGRGWGYDGRAEEIIQKVSTYRKV